MTETIKHSSSVPSSDSPAQSTSPNVIELDSIMDSKIIGVSVYSARAEITCLFTFDVKAGQNQLEVRNLPCQLDQDSFSDIALITVWFNNNDRVEGRGAATVHDVTLGQVARSRLVTGQVSPETWGKLQLSKKNIEKAIERTKRAITFTAQYVEPAKIADIVKQYDEAAASLDSKVMELEAQKSDIESQIRIEMGKVMPGTADYSMQLNIKASIGMFADLEGEIKIALTYAVGMASWKAGYDVRVDMQTKGKPIQMVYKAAITQNTMNWDNVTLTLETAKPTIGLSVPTLNPWRLSAYKPPVMEAGSTKNAPLTSKVRSRASAFGTEMASQIKHRATNVSSDGAISATFSVPGLISVPSDGIAHNVTIAEFSLDATMSWLCIPKQDTKTHIKATIKNASEYPLLPGKVSIHVDGSFISKTSIPLVSPEESFDCPLGVDPSIRVTYHPRSKKTSRSGFYTKSTNYVYQQRITIHNTKTQVIKGFKVLDQFPISENSDITVKHINPPLILPSSQPNSITGSAVGDETLSVKISSDVVAQWDGADEAEKGEIPVDLVGKEGKVAWICSVPAGSKLGLVMHWEVSTPVDTMVTGL
ncbi:hypothetical protein BJ165DRAFT_1413836 [Panaeolus papilionaceus]|nr:hypothetical protein BJ165DRAFT_1413836 [Panaeolus papilionaceus]